MVDSGSINGVPATSSHYLLTDILRGQMGFQGVVISDYQDVIALQSTYHIAADLPSAVADAVNAGVDMSMEVSGPDQWQSAVVQDVKDGKISQARINQAVRRILTMKFQLGLFDQGCVARSEHPLREREHRRRGRDLRPRPDAAGGRGVDDAAAQPEQRAAARADRARSRHRPERRLDDQPARWLERELAGCVRGRTRVLAWAPRIRFHRAPPCRTGF